MVSEPQRIWGAAAVAVALLAAGSFSLAQRQWRHDLSQARRAGETSVAELAPLLESALRSARYADVPDVLQRWGRADPTVALITVTARNGFELGRFSRDASAAPQLQFQVPFTYGYAGDAVVTLTVDTAGALARRRQLAVELALGNLVLDVLILGAARLLVDNRRTVRRYRVLYAANEALIVGSDEREAFLARIVEAVVREGGYALVWIGFLAGDGSLEPAAVAGPAAGYAEGLEITSRPDVPQGQGPSGRSLREGRAVVVGDFRSEPAMSPWATRARLYRIRSSMAVPLVVDGVTLGLLGLYSGTAQHFDADERAMAEQLAADIAFGLEHRRRGERVRVELERNRRFLENAVDFVHIMDRDGRLVAASRSFCEFLGYPFEELVGRQPQTWNVDVDDARVHSDVGRALGGEVVRFASVYRRRDGATADVEVLLSAFSIGGEIYLYASARSLAELKRLERELLDAANREQRRLGQEMHDGLGHELTTAALAAEMLAAGARAQGLPTAAALDSLAGDVRRCIGTARAIVRGLSPLVEVGGSLAGGLAELGGGKRSVSGTDVIVDADPDCDAGLSAEAKSHLFRIAQEALQNALKYARASRVWISLGREGGQVVLTVGDDGVGLPDDYAERSGYGMGTMSYRARALRGRLDVEPRAGGGTLITCRVPQGV